MSRAASLPLSDHCDGVRFHNPALEPSPLRPSAARGLLPFLRWRLEGGRAAWPEHVPDPAPAGDPYAPPPPDGCSLTFLGHACFLIRFPGLTLLTDPVFSERCSPVSWAGPRRVRPPGLPLDALPPVDLVLLSHNHYDHMDLPTLRRLHRRDAPALLAPLNNSRILQAVGLPAAAELDWWQSHRHGALTATATPARHFSARSPFDARTALWSGFMLDHGGFRLLFAGDSGDGPHWQLIRERLGAPDLALLPIGAYAPRHLMAPVHMNPEEALDAHRSLDAGCSIGMHFGTFQLTDEPVDEPERRLAAAVSRAGLAPEAFTTLGHGETRRFGPSSSSADHGTG